jgi:hypothetical protein
MNFPETSGGFCGVLGKLRGADSVLAASHGEVAKHVTHPLAESVSKLFNYVVNGVTRAAGVAAVLDKRQLGICRPQNVVVVQVNRRIKLVESHIRHDSKFNAYFF